jgi:hypothetical protein
MSKPLWRRWFDRIEHTAGPPLESAVRSDAFAIAFTVITRMRAQLNHAVESQTQRMWHVVNLPSASDIRHVTERVVSLDREMRQLRRLMEDDGFADSFQARSGGTDHDGAVHGDDQDHRATRPDGAAGPGAA